MNPNVPMLPSQLPKGVPPPAPGVDINKALNSGGLTVNTPPTSTPVSPAKVAAVSQLKPGTVSVKDFAQAVKTKHPEYSSFDDQTLTAAVVKKYPEYADKVDMHSGVKEQLSQPVPPQGIGANLTTTPLGRAKDVAIGAAKGLVGTAQQGMDIFDPLVGKLADPISPNNVYTGKPESISARDTVPDSWKKTTNTAQKVGYGGEQIAEMFAPIGGAAKEGVTAVGRAGESLPKVLEYTRPALSKAEELAAKEAGNVETTGRIFKTVVPKTTLYDRQVATAAKEIGVNASESFDKNIAKINDGLTKYTTDIKTGLTERKAMYNPNQFKGALNKIEPPVMIKSDATLDNAYKLVKNKALDIEKSITPKTKANLFEGRIAFDKYVQQEFPNLYKDERLTPMRQAIRDIRSGWNNLIAQGLPQYRETLNKESLLFDARENIAAKAPRIGESINPVKKFASKHPYLTGAGAAIGGAAAEKELKKYLPFLP